MSIQTLRDRLPEYAKDLKLSLGTLAGETVLDDAKKAGTFVAAAIASRNPEVIEAVVAEFGPRLDPADVRRGEGGGGDHGDEQRLLPLPAPRRGRGVLEAAGAACG